jgi:uncharacterized protein YprB with RNaseH-like and TPR domain
MSFLERTFQLVPDIGPFREKELWARGINTWSEFERRASQNTVIHQGIDGRLVEAIAVARGALARNNLQQLAALVPKREHWRLVSTFSHQTAYFDIEADEDQKPTVVGVLDQHGIASFRRGLNLDTVSERLRASSIWVTFNGSVFDVPQLQKNLSSFPRPEVHIDLRFLAPRAKLHGGLKNIESCLGIVRPGRIEGTNGLAAIALWKDWETGRNVKALRTLTEYNLYDAINLRSILRWICQRFADKALPFGVTPSVLDSENFESQVDRLLMDNDR